MSFSRSSFGTRPFTNDAAAAASGSTGTLAKTNANDTVSASGTTTVTGTLAKTNANDSCAASGSVGGLGVSGTLATTNAADTSAASGTTTVTGAVAKTNANDSVSASGTTTIVGSLAKTNANDSVVASGAAGSISGTVAYTNANDTCVASSAAAVGGSYDDKKRKKRYIVKKDGKLLVFNDEALASSILDDELESEAKIIPQKPAKKEVKQQEIQAPPALEINLAELKQQAELHQRQREYEQLLANQRYEALIRLYERLQEEEEEDELLLMAA